MKLICFGVRKVERDFFINLNRFGYELTLVEELLNDDNINLVENHEAIMLRANCPANKKNLELFKKYGIKYILTRTVGYNHIDLDASRELGFKVARVPTYSPNAIGELVITFAMNLVRKGVYMINRSLQKNFIVDEFMFSREIRNLTVGIIGTGKIGLTTAKLFKGLGSNIIAYDVYKNESAKEFLEYVSLDELIKTSDIISLHCPYIKGVNDNLIDDDFINKAKDDVIIINTARGELQDVEAVIRGLENGKVGGFATDVFSNEKEFFFKDMRNKTIDENIEKLLNLYPKVLITPHIGSYTDEALTNMIEISYENLKEFIETGFCENQL
ncbi:2-hydroxyacid dehydrogenase [Cetobacterium somerae]|uniref:2-hydroxyacid dehydrogenase n=1 Tax=Cetobacterium sp. NK01 TaxID=2993530 RepID=UPI0021172A74|nr:2-hydroxyacid dehydrogenase [Cetobacterium sp. NK01]MCQ8212828.1 2-hydroxyacid dehydrogenase [Cetobacterium sp. NK01]